MDLSPRLLNIIELVEPVLSIADIGTDHGYVPARLLQVNLAEHVIATDVSQPSLDKSERLLVSLFSPEKFDTRCGDGLKVLNHSEVDAVIIAGMGGQLMIRLLEDAPELVKSLEYLILQPMQGVELLFDWLSTHGFHLLDVRLAREDRRYYPILKLKYTGDNEVISYDSLSESQNYKSFVRSRLNHYQQIEDQIRASSSNKTDLDQILDKKQEWVKRYENL